MTKHTIQPILNYTCFKQDNIWFIIIISAVMGILILVITTSFAVSTYAVYASTLLIIIITQICCVFCMCYSVAPTFKVWRFFTFYVFEIHKEKNTFWLVHDIQPYLLTNNYQPKQDYFLYTSRTKIVIVCNYDILILLKLTM